MREITVTRNDADQRLDRFLRKFLPGASLAMIYKMIRKDIKVNGKRADENTRLREGDVIALYLGDTEFGQLTRTVKERGRTGARRNFRILYEDDNILAADKPFGLLTHGDRTEKKNHLANQVLDYLIETGAYDPRERTFAPAPANRLDRNTTGIVLFGKTGAALRALTAMIRDSRIDKRYTTVAFGQIPEALELTGRLVKDEESNLVRVLPADAAEGKLIRTSVRPLRQFGTATLVEIGLDTGRSHQIRAHLAAIGHPVVGDTKYQTAQYRQANDRLRRECGLKAQLLHSSSVTFLSDSGPLAYLCGRTIRSELPESFGIVIKHLEEPSK